MANSSSSNAVVNMSNLSEARRTANLRVLQRLDSSIVDVALTATHVVLYEFKAPPQSSWQKMNVEGSLFIVKRSNFPRFKLVIMNRNSTENLEVAITSSFQMQLREPYMIFRDLNPTNNNSSDTIRGLWFHDGTEREQVHSYLENVVKSLQKIDEMERLHPPPPSLQVLNHSNNSHDDSIATAKPKPVEVNTNAAGAALLSTLNLNFHNKKDNNNKQQQNQEEIEAQSSPPTVCRIGYADVQPQQQLHSPLSSPTPALPSSTATSKSNNSNNNNNALDKKSLQLALLSLIQDERFLDLIHAQYLKVVNSRSLRSGGSVGEQHQLQKNSSSSNNNNNNNNRSN